MKLRIVLLAAICAAFAFADKAEEDFKKTKTALQKMTGCFLVDYSFVETESMRKDYTVDRRVYDVNATRSVKEWIYPVEVTDKKIRLQHILFAADKDGKVSEESLLKHQAEDWEYGPAHSYDFVAPSKWEVKKNQEAAQWVRRITNLDDGLRYQCVAPWKHSGGNPEWACENYAPIPGRESRDMGRKDYQTLARSTRLIVYGDSWLDRQANTKTVHEGEKKEPLAKEVGKTWFVRLPESECKVAAEWAKPRQAYWTLLREVWDEVLDGRDNFTEKVPQGAPPRFAAMLELEAKYFEKVATDKNAAKTARLAMLALIEAYRVK